LGRNQLSWLTNGTVRNGGITQRTGWQPLAMLRALGYWQGGFLYTPDSANPFLICQISGVLYGVLLDPPYTITDLTGGDPTLQNPATKDIAEMAWFVQAENYCVIQAGDYYTQPNLLPAGSPNGYVGQTLAIASSTLPLIWSGVPSWPGVPGAGTGILRRSRGITNLVPTIAPNINEIPAATCMDYYGNHLWYAQARQFSAGDTAGGPSGNAINHFRDSVLSVTENPLCFGGDGFSLPTYSGNIRSLSHSANINASLGQGQFFISTRKTVYSMTVPTTRNDWIAADANNQPQLSVVQLVNGPVGHRCVVPVNGDIFYQSFEPGIRSLIIATRYFQQWANTPISQNENRALESNDRSLMRFSSGIQFNNRILNLVLPKLAADGENVVHQAILPLDFDSVSNLAGVNNPVWEGAYSGLPFVELFSGDFGGLPRAFAVVISEIDGSLNLWELTTSSRTENGDNRVLWSAEFPALTWQTSKLEYQLKHLTGGECWIDSISGTVEMTAYYRVDGDPCWRYWFTQKPALCTARNAQEEIPIGPYYPPQDLREGYAFPVTFPAPPIPGCDSMRVRPPTIGYQFQVMLVFKGWCRVRGLLLYCESKEKPQYQGLSQPGGGPIGMKQLPNPFS
jgi:hypothetical protein